jgi:hypothetical protein
MNIIQHLQLDKNYAVHAAKALQVTAETIDIDYTKGETDNTLILFIEKNNLSFTEAMSILTMKQKMLHEEWDDLELYNNDDIKHWASLLVKEYGKSTYYENVTDDEFLNDHFVHRLRFETGIVSIFYNDSPISYKTFQEIIPCKNNYIKIAKSGYTRLEAEYYIETELHYILFNWYATA